MKVFKRALAAATALLLLALLPVSALAETYYIDQGAITVYTNDSGQYVTQVNGAQDEKQTTETVITQTEGTGATGNWITIKAAADTEAKVTLDDVNISQGGGYAMQTKGEGDVTIELEGSNTVKANGSPGGKMYQGLDKNNKGELTINDVDSDGSLTAQGGGDSAGISGSNITINGGTIKANGAAGAAGIGGDDGGSVSNITINGGTVTATGGDNAAGIGGGKNGSASNITINGGTVTATGRNGGAAIGGGAQKDGTDITITGGTVTAKATWGAGIGGGFNGNGTDITISGGTVDASAASGAAIGGGEQGNGTGITISGGDVTAKSGKDSNSADAYDSGAGIGGGAAGTGSNIVISGDAVVRARGGVADGLYGTGAAIGNGAAQGVDIGVEAVIDTTGLYTTGRVEYYTAGSDMTDPENIANSIVGTVEPPEPEPEPEDPKPTEPEVIETATTTELIAPATDDGSSAVWLVLALTSGAALALLCFRKKRSISK